MVVKVSLCFLHSEPKLRNRGTGVGYKIPPAKVCKRPTLQGLFRLSTLCGVSLNPLDRLDFSNNELLHSSTGPLQGLSGPHYQLTFYSDRLFSESLPDFFRSRTTLLRTSFRLRQYPSFSDSQISTVTRLHSSFYGGRPPFGFQPSSCESRTPTAGGLLWILL